MAIPRLFNSYSPFLVVERGSGRTFLEKQEGPAGEEGEGPNEEEGSLLARAIRPQLSRALERGTAQDMTSEWPGALQKNPYVSIVAQAEGEMQGLADVFSQRTNISSPSMYCGLDWS